MSKLTDAITWAGRGATLSLFAIFPAGLDAEIRRPSRDALSRVKTYHLEDVDERLRGRTCSEYDLSFDELPLNLESVVLAWLDAALAAGADIAWFAFEGSFDFDHVLTADVASQVFAMGSQRSIELAFDDRTRLAAGWATRVVDLREQVGL